MEIIEKAKEFIPEKEFKDLNKIIEVKDNE